MLMVPVPVPAVVVNPVGAALLKPPIPPHVSVPPLKVKFLVPVPVMYSKPAVRVNPLRSMVPKPCVKVRVDPIVNASSSRCVPPGPPKYKGKSIVLPLVVMVRGVAEVDTKLVMLFPESKVMPADKVRLPSIERVWFDSEPAKPVKFKFRTLPPRVSVYVPLVMLKLIVSASLVRELTSTVVAVAVALVTLTTGVPVTVSPVTLSVLHARPGLVTVMLPVPNASVRVLVLLLLKAVDVRVRLLRFSVPCVSVKVLDSVVASSRRNVPPGALTVIGKMIFLPALVKSIVPRPAKVCAAAPVTVTPEPSV